MASGLGLLNSVDPFGDPDDGDDGNEDENDDDEELFQDGVPTNEKDIVDSRALHNAKIDPIPFTDAEPPSSGIGRTVCSC